MTTNQTKPPKKYQTYMLRTCNSDYTSHNGFRYPKKGFVYAPDWDDKPIYDKGIRGLLRGEGSPSYLSQYIWQVLMVDSREVVYLDGVVKVPRAWVLLSGSRDEAVAKMQELGCYLCAFGKATASMCGTANAGQWGTANAGDWGTATAGYMGTATAGYMGTATAGKYGTATAGIEGTATAGDNGTATAGKYGTATAGTYGTATAVYYGTATAGYGGTASAGNYGTIQIKYRDTKSSRHRTAIGYIGENGLLPNVRYNVDNEGKFYEVK